MKRLFKLLFLLAVFSFKANAQSCLHTDLSTKFDYKVIRSDHQDNDTSLMKSTITIEVYSKSDQKLFQKLQFTSTGYIISNTFTECSNDRSFITGHNMKPDIADEDYGDIVVADLNFDGKEDFAVKYNIPADVGPEYCYFIQGDHGFKKDEYLSKNMPFFPWLMKPQKQTLISIVSPNWGTHIYQFQYNRNLKKWRKIGDRFVWHDQGLDKILKRLKK
jgi:hypothetical protein